MKLFLDEGKKNTVIEEQPNGKIVLQGEESSHIKEEFDMFELSESSKYLKQKKSEWILQHG